jgi:hypothetical protein
MTVFKTIEEFVDFLASKNSASESGKLRLRGSSDVASQIRNSFPLLSDSYIKFVDRWIVEEVTLGYFIPSPGVRPGGSLSDKLREANSAETNPFFSLLQEKGMIEVGSFEGDPILVATRQSFAPEGSVYWLDIEKEFPEPMWLAKNFEQGVLVAANLWALLLDGWKKKEEFETAMSTLGIPAPAKKNWRSLSLISGMES